MDKFAQFEKLNVTYLFDDDAANRVGDEAKQALPLL